MSLTDDIAKKIDDIFAGFGVPRYIWEPIMQQESSGDPRAHANTKKEDSRGLFQINIKANPKYKDKDLFDPLVNAEIAARDFIAPAYKQAMGEGILDPAKSALYTWRYGIRPNWESVQESGKDKALASHANQIFYGASTSEPPSGGSDSSGWWQKIVDWMKKEYPLDTGVIIETPDGVIGGGSGGKIPLPKPEDSGEFKQKAIKVTLIVVGILVLLLTIYMLVMKGGGEQSG